MSRGERDAFDGVSTMPLYNIRTVVHRTGVPAPTLRSWERRYGIPSPAHDERGYRLYSERDIEMVRWLRAQVEQGVAVSRAVSLLLPQPSDPESGEVALADADFASLSDRLVQSICAMDEPAANALISEALGRAPVEGVALHVLQPALYRVGDLWAQGRLSVTVERFGSNLIHAYLAQLMRLNPAPLRDERLLVGCAPGDHHDLGPLMLALFLRRAGFDVLYVGANPEADSLIADANRLATAAVCLGVSIPSGVPALIDLYSRLAPIYSGIPAFGGRVFVEAPELISLVPGLYLGDDAITAVRFLTQALGAAAS